MKILSISTDRNIFKKGSVVQTRMIEYGQLFDELHIVIFTRAGHGAEKMQISSNVWAYPTNSWTRWFYVRGAVRIGSEIIKGRNFLKTDDVITVQDPFDTGLPGLRLKRLFSLPFHVQVHTDFLSEHFKRHSILNRLRARLARKVLREANAVRVVSKRIKRSIEEKKITRAPIEIVPIFVDVKRIDGAPVNINLKKKYPQFNFIILIASRFSEEKNIPLAFQMMKRLLKIYPRAGLIVVGEGPEKHRLIWLTKRLEILKNVVFEPWQEDIISYYKTANIFLSTSEYEGYGLSMVEAIAAHCPVIGTDAGIAPELLHDGEVSFVCPVGDASCIFENIKKLIEDSSLRERFILEAFERLGDVTFIEKSDYLNKYKESIKSALFEASKRIS